MKFLRRGVFTVCIALCLILTGCNNEFAKKEYNDSDKIVKTEDRYAKGNSVFNPIEGGYSLKVDKFDGRETLWKKNVDSDTETEITVQMSLSGGFAKVVYIDDNDNVLTIVECTSENKDADVTQTIALKKGTNRIKVVGYSCKDLICNLLIEQ